MGRRFRSEVHRIERVLKIVHDIHLSIPRSRMRFGLGEQVNGTDLQRFVLGVEFTDGA